MTAPCGAPAVRVSAEPAWLCTYCGQSQGKFWHSFFKALMGFLLLTVCMQDSQLQFLGTLCCQFMIISNAVMNYSTVEQ